MPAAFRVTVYDKTLRRVGFVGAYESCVATPRHNQISTTQLVLPTTHRQVPNLFRPGARVVVDYDGEFLMSGPVWAITGDLGPAAPVTFSVESDFRIIGRMLGWPNPAGPVTEQGTTAATDTMTGPADDVAKRFLRRNAARLGMPVVVEPDLGRGPTVTVSSRMQNLADVLVAAVDQAGVGIDVRQQDGVLRVSTYQPQQRTRVLTTDSGVIVGGSYSRTGPAATRGVVGGSGAGTAREYRAVVDAAREAEWGAAHLGEVFIDASDTAAASGLDARGVQALAGAGPTSGFRFVLAETATFRYGRTVRVGDRVPMRAGPGIDPVVDVVREATISDTRDGGVVVTPSVGEPQATDQPDVTIARAVAQLGRAFRNLMAGR